MQTESGIRRLIRDLIDLTELQIQLIKVDGQAAKQHLSSAFVSGLVAILLGGAAFMVTLVASGFLLHEWTELSTGSSLLIVGMVSFLIVASLSWFCIRSLRSASTAMAETKNELTENLQWMKSTLSSTSTGDPPTTANTSRIRNTDPSQVGDEN